MSALTRILNNQIYSKTIIASQKIADGTITGSLFSSNVTIPGDFLITGNLFVLGTSAYTTVASTNTYVNDPLIVLNNGFAGTNTYDEGLVFNRGSLQNRALIWSEYFQEFRLIGTTETGTAYGNVAVSNYANIHVGNITVDYSANVGSLTSSGGINGVNAILSGDLAVGGGDITTSASTATVFTANATSVDAFTTATGIRIGANSGELLINNPNIQGSQSTQYLFTANATAIDFGTSATTLSMGATSGVASLQNANIWLPNATTVGNGQDTINLFNLPATVSALRAGTVIQIGATSGLLQINNPTVDATQSSVSLFNANVTTLNFAGAASTINMGANSGTLTIGNPTVVGTQTTQNLYNTTATTLNAFGAATTLTLGATTGLGTIRNQVINFPNLTDMVTGQTSINVFNANVTTLNLAGAGTLITIGSTAGNTIIRTAETFIEGVANVNATRDATSTTSAALTVAGGAAVKAGMIVGGTFYANASAGSTQQNLGIGAIVIPTGGISVGGTANIAGYTQINGATQLNSSLTVGGIEYISNTTNAISAEGDSGALQVKGGVSIAKDVHIGGNLYVSNIFSTSYNILSVTDPLLYLQASNTYPYSYDIGVYSNFVGPDARTGLGNVYQHTGVIRDNADSTWKFVSNVRSEPDGGMPIDSDTQYDPVLAGNLTLTYNQEATSTSTGSFKTAGGIGVAGNVFIGGAYIDTSSTNALILNTPLTVDAFKAATDLEIGATSGTAVINNPTLRGSQTTQDLFNTVADTINFGRAANITMGINAGTTTVQGNLTVQSVRESTDTTTGALTLSGGLGLAGNIFQAGAYHDTSASNFLLLGTPTTVDAFKAATDLEVGATTGTMTINNPTVVGTQATQALYNTVTATLNFARSANITMGHTDGTTTLQGNANIRAVTESTSFTNGALVVAGGTGIAGDVNIKGTKHLTIGKDIAGGVIYPENTVQVTTNANSTSRISIQNASTGQIAASEFFASADNGSNVSAFVATGITSSTFNPAAGTPILGPNDGYTVATGNLVLSAGTDVVIASSGLGNVGVRVSALNANVGVQYATESTTEKTGALTVVGGVGIGKDLNVGKGLVVNTLNSSDNFKVNSSVAGNVAIFANVATTYGAASEFVVIGGGNLTVQPGAALKIGAISSMLLPVGPTAGRPSSLFGNASYDVPGMIRFNSTINNVEFFDGTQWAATGSTFTVISDRQFAGNIAGGYGNVDGTNTVFTIQSTATTSSTIVSINGVLQFPTLAYSVSGDQLTFTEPPAPDDVIDVRVLTTTTTVSSIASGSGLNQFIADNNGSAIWTGTSATTERLLITPAGDINVVTSGNINVQAGSKTTYDQSAKQVVNTNLTLLDSFSANSYTTAKYVISMRQGTGNVQAMEALLTQSTHGSTAGTAYITTYGVVNTGNTMGTLAANVDVSGNWTVNMWLIPNNGTAISNVKVMTTYIV